VLKRAFWGKEKNMKKESDIFELANIIIDYIELKPELKYKLYPRDLATYIVRRKYEQSGKEIVDR